MLIASGDSLSQSAFISLPLTGPILVSEPYGKKGEV